MLKMVVFDLDGTIGDTVPMCIEAFEKSIAPYTDKSVGKKEIVETFGINEIGTIKALVPKAHWDDAIRDFYAHYVALHYKCETPYSGICELIRWLLSEGVRTALVTGKAEKSCRITLEKYGMNELFEDIEPGIEDKPSKSINIAKLMAKYSLLPEELAYVGDTLSDVFSSREAGVKCLSAAWKEDAETGALEAENPGLVFKTIPALRAYLADCLPK